MIQLIFSSLYYETIKGTLDYRRTTYQRIEQIVQTTHYYVFLFIVKNIEILVELNSLSFLITLLTNQAVNIEFYNGIDMNMIIIHRME